MLYGVRLPQCMLYGVRPLQCMLYGVRPLQCMLHGVMPLQCMLHGVRPAIGTQRVSPARTQTLVTGLRRTRCPQDTLPTKDPLLQAHGFVDTLVVMV